MDTGAPASALFKPDGVRATETADSPAAGRSVPRPVL
jgi:hypothetical protein